MKYKIAVFPGDGVGPELIKEGIKVLEKAAELDKFGIEWISYPFGQEHYEDTKETLSENVLKEIKKKCDAIYCGTFNNLGNEKTKAENNVPAIIRNYFEQFASLRPIRLFPTIESVIASKTSNDINFAIIRENTEDFYLELSAKVKEGKNRNKFEIKNKAVKVKLGVSIESNEGEVAYQIGVLSQKGCERIMRFAFDFAKENEISKITIVDKANSLKKYDFWRDSAKQVSNDYKGIELEFELVDNTVMNFLRQPEKYKLIVAPNMFGDILSDMGTIMQGSLAVSARASINPESVSMFEPVHGSAPKLREQGLINPIAIIWAGALMLQNIGQKKSGGLIIKAIEGVLKEDRTRTQDIGGNNSTTDMADAIKDKFIDLHD
jgi:tartrate dehydrogenase/decarboxylase / D-malate dehydrogenase